MRIGMVHQPHFLPWPGYLARCLAVDVFVVLDNVKFNRNHYQQRTKFVDHHAELRWLTLPILGSTRSGPISDVQIASDFRIKKWQRPILESYREAPFIAPVWNNVTKIISAQHPNFCDVSLELITWMIGNLCFSASHQPAEVIRTSQIKTSTNRTLRLVDICRTQKITHLVMGKYAFESHDVDLLREFDISLMSQRYIGPKKSRAVPGVMAIHHIMWDGWECTGKNLRAHWVLETIEKQ